MATTEEPATEEPGEPGEPGVATTEEAGEPGIARVLARVAPATPELLGLGVPVDLSPALAFVRFLPVKSIGFLCGVPCCGGPRGGGGGGSVPAGGGGGGRGGVLASLPFAWLTWANATDITTYTVY